MLLNAQGHFWAFTSCTSSTAVNCLPTEHRAPSERLYFVFEPENLIFTKHLISSIHLAMLPQFPSSTPGFGVFNYWETGFVWSGAKIGLWLANSEGNHTGSNQFNYPPIKVERPVIAVKGWQWGPRFSPSILGCYYQRIIPSCRGCYAQAVQFHCKEQSSRSLGKHFFIWRDITL